MAAGSFIYSKLYDINVVLMVKAIVDISEHANRIINIVKAKEGLKDKSQAIEKIVEDFEDKILEPPFKPEFVQELLEQDKRIKSGKEKFIHVGHPKNLRKALRLD